MNNNFQTNQYISVAHHRRQVKLENEALLSQIPEIIQLIKLCMDSSYFSFREKFYTQRFGTPMGSPLSPLIADIFMEKLEMDVLSHQNSYKRPTIWRRYVDDTFCIWEHSDEDLNTFLTELNNYDEHIKFTMEKENDQKISFLDVLIIRQQSELKTTIYRKPTSTFKLIDIDSAHPFSNKAGTLNCLITRAFRLCDPEFLNDELQTLRKIFTENGYSASFSNKIIKRVKTKLENRTPTETEEESNNDREKETKPHLLILPFDKNLEVLLRPLKRRHNLKIVFKPFDKLRRHLVHPKDPTILLKKCNVVYSIPCSDGNEYIGETSRPLEKRINEHKEAVKKLDAQKSAIAEYILQTGARPLWNEVTVLAKEDDWFRRRIKEALWIDRKGIINKSHGLEAISRYWLENHHDS